MNNAISYSYHVPPLYLFLFSLFSSYSLALLFHKTHIYFRKTVNYDRANYQNMMITLCTILPLIKRFITLQ